MSNLLQTMITLLNRKEVVKKIEPLEDYLVLGRTPNTDSTFGLVTPIMKTHLINLKEIKKYFDTGENEFVSGSGTDNHLTKWKGSQTDFSEIEEVPWARFPDNAAGVDFQRLELAANKNQFGQFNEGGKAQIGISDSKRTWFSGTNSNDVGQFPGIFAISNDSRATGNGQPPNSNVGASTALALYNSTLQEGSVGKVHMLLNVGRQNRRDGGGYAATGLGNFYGVFQIRANGDIYTGGYESSHGSPTTFEVPGNTLHVGNVQIGLEALNNSAKPYVFISNGSKIDVGANTHEGQVNIVYSSGSKRGIALYKNSEDASANDYAHAQIKFEGAGANDRLSIHADDKEHGIFLGYGTTKNDIILQPRSAGDFSMGTVDISGYDVGNSNAVCTPFSYDVEKFRLDLAGVQGSSNGLHIFHQMDKTGDDSIRFYFENANAGAHFSIQRQGTGAPKITFTTTAIELDTDASVGNNFTVNNDLQVDNEATIAGKATAQGFTLLGHDSVTLAPSGDGVAAIPKFVSNPSGVIHAKQSILTEKTNVSTKHLLVNTTDHESTYGLGPDLRVARSFTGGGVIDIYRNDSTVTAGEDAGTLQFSVQDDNKYAVAQIQVKTIADTDSGNSGGGLLEIKTAAPQSGQAPQKRISVTNTTAEVLVDLNANNKFKAEDIVELNGLEAHADDAAAGAAGITQNQLYMTDGTGAAPLNVAGIVMIKQ